MTDTASHRPEPMSRDAYVASVPCAECGAPTDELDLFPGRRCLACHAAWFDTQPMPTAREIRAMWGIK